MGFRFLFLLLLLLLLLILFRGEGSFFNFYQFFHIFSYVSHAPPDVRYREYKRSVNDMR